MRWALVAFLAAACGQQTAADVDLYEDLPAPDGKADGVSLPALHAVAGYEAIQEPRIVTADLEIGAAKLRAGDRLLLIRRLDLDDVPSYVAVDVDVMQIGVADAAAVDDATRAAGDDELADAPYLQELGGHRDAAFATLPFISSDPSKVLFALTIDMCQSSRAWERGLFDFLIAAATPGHPTAVGIAMTGYWATAHPKELRQLIAWQQDGKLDITWINHSYRHELSKDAAGHYRFLTAPEVDFRSDVLELEKLLLGQGVVFSPLFRFPGLTHDAHRLAQLNDLSLFALDADGWIAKGQPLADGALVLLHGNGNEHVGIDMFFEQVKKIGEERLVFTSPTDVLWE